MACDTIKIETLDADEVVSIVTQGPQGPSGAEAATLTTTGDLLYRAALANDRLPIGSEGQVLKVSSGIPAWGNESGAVTSVNGETGAVVLDAADVGAQSVFSYENITITGNTTLTASRATIYDFTAFSGTPYDVTLPTTGNQVGDIIVARVGFVNSASYLTFKLQNGSIRGQFGFVGFRIYRWVNTDGSANGWQQEGVELHAQNLSDSSAVVGTLPVANLPVGTTSSHVAAGNHDHGNINSSGLVGTTANLPLKTGTGGIVEAGAFGTGAGEFAEGNHTHTQLHDKSHTMTDATSHTAGNHKVFYSDGSGQIQELALGNSGEVLTSNGATSAPSFAAAAAGGSKTYTVFTATDNQPPASNYATLDTRNSIAVLDFDDATDESAVFVSIIPEAASLASGLKIRLHWMATTATSGNVVWDVSLERMTTDLDSDSFDTIASGTAAANGTSGILTVTEITLTTIDSVTAGDGFRLRVTRDANNASDTMTGDAELVVCEVRSAA